MAAPQTAIRVGDDILHSEANSWGFFGIVEGALIGLAVGVLVVSTGGLAGVALVAGAAMLGGALGGKLGEIYGRHQTHANGHVLTGSPNVFIGFDKQPAARADADVGHCDQDSDSEPAHDQPAVIGRKIAQGSGTVLINNFHAARSGDKGTCDFTLGDGWPNVFIGGPTQTVVNITSETASLDHVILGMMVVGGALLAAPAVAGVIGAGIAAETGIGTIALQVGTRLGGQFLLGAALSKGGGAGLKYVGGKAFGDGSLGQDISEFVGENAVPFVGMIKIPGLGESSYGWIDSMPERFGFGNKAAGAAADASGAAASDVPAGADAPAAADAPTVGTADAPAAADVPAAEPAGENTPQRYGGTGADPELTSTEASQARANAAYDQIRSNPNDVAQIAQNTGHSPETIQTVKDHLFNSQHDILDPNTGEVSQGNFTPDEGIANLWNKAADGSLGQPRMTNWDTPIAGSANPAEITQFNQLVAHEYVESQMVADGFPYQARGSWTENPEGGWDYKPNPDNFGAHELSPNFTENPYSHYEKITGLSPDGIPRPNADNSNLDEVVSGIRRTLAENGVAPGSRGSGGGMGTGAEARVPSARSGLPEPEPFDPASPLPPTAVEGIGAVPPGDAAPVAVADAAPEAAEATAAPLPEAQAAQAEPEPPPAAAAPSISVNERANQSGVENTSRPTLKDNIRNAIPPGSRRLSNPTVTSTKVPYNGSDLSNMVVNYRQANTLMNSQANLAVIEYTHNGVKGWEVGESEFNGPHSEESAWGKLFGKGVQPGEVEKIYTEREPCTLPGHACGRWIKSLFPNAEVSHSFDYGQTAASRAAGNDALSQALQLVRGGK